MRTYRLVLIGLGNVAQGFLELLRAHGQDWAQRFGVGCEVVAACTGSHGSVVRPEGLEPAELLGARDLAKLPGDHGRSALDIITRCQAEVVIELSPTNLATGEPARAHLRAALAAGKHVITANKGPIALHYPELKALADEKNLFLGLEGTVLSGTPALGLGLVALKAARIRRVEGLLNGTTNYILTRMEAGDGYPEALAAAQAKGYAEADPRGDVEGHDAAAKLAILGNLLWERSLTPADVRRRGITQLTPRHLERARRAGQRWKLVGRVSADEAWVEPRLLPLEHPLAGVGGALNALTYHTQALGAVTVIGPGTGRRETGYAVLGDLLSLHRRLCGPKGPLL